MKPDEAEKIRREWIEELRKWLSDYEEDLLNTGPTCQPGPSYYIELCDLLKARIQILEAVNTDELR